MKEKFNEKVIPVIRKFINTKEMCIRDRPYSIKTYTESIVQVRRRTGRRSEEGLSYSCENNRR